MSRGLTNLEIEKCMNRHARLRKFFRGCFPIDELPVRPAVPFALIVNLDKGNEPGSHWVALVSTSTDRIEYFDSFGNPPPPLLAEFTGEYAHIFVNRHRFQSPLSIVCGHYCVFFVTRRALGEPVERVMNELKSAPKPDLYVARVYSALCR